MGSCSYFVGQIQNEILQTMNIKLKWANHDITKVNNDKLDKLMSYI
jgi:hypothetical protein